MRFHPRPGADRTGQVYADVWEYMPAVSSAAAPGHEAGGGGAGGDGVAAAPAAVPSGWRAHAKAAHPAGARSGHAAAPAHVRVADGCSACVVVFGGQDPRSSVLYNDVQLLGVPEAAPAEAPANQPSTEARWVEGLAVDGKPPEPRNGHSLCVDDGANADRPHAACHLYVFGGASSEGHLADVHRLTVSSATAGGAEGDGAAAAGGGRGLLAVWEELRCSGTPPAPREMHVSCIVSSRQVMLVHGGRSETSSGDTILDDVCILSLGSLAWAPLFPSAARRVGHAAALVPSPPAPPSRAASEPRLLLVGGFSGEAFCEDTISFTPTERLDKGGRGALLALDVRAREPPQPRFAHCAASLGQKLCVHTALPFLPPS